MDPDRDVRDNVFSAFSEKEKTESPSSDEISDDIPAAQETSQVEMVAPVELKDEVNEVSEQPTDCET
jgi:hypothetical protein